MISLAVPDLTGNEKKYLDDCIDTTFVSSVGEYVTRFERMVAEATESRNAVAVSAGTTGLHAALHGAGVRYGELVIIPTFTFIASANAVRQCGAEPWLMDVELRQRPRGSESVVNGGRTDCITGRVARGWPL